MIALLPALLAVPLFAAEPELPPTLQEGLRLLASSSSGKKVAESLRGVEYKPTSLYTGMEGRTMYIDKSYIAPGASPRLAAVVLAVTGADVGESAVPAHSKEGVHLSHLLCYRVAVELDIPPAEIGKVFGASIADWIENPARERASLRDVDYGSIYDEKPEEYLSKWDLSKSRARYETFEKETEEWAKAHEKELEAWRAKMRAWLASPEAKDR